MENLIIVKIGGSVVTEKERTDHNLREALLTQIFSILKDHQEKQTDRKLIIIHGAGGHIHALAAQYGLKTGAQDEKKHEGALITQQAASQLNQDIIRIATKAGLSATPIPTHEVVENNNGRITNMALERVSASLTENNIPVLYGDIVRDDALTYSICSGDAVLAHLTEQYNVKKVFFASDIDGVFTKDPHVYQDAKLLTNISISHIADIAHVSESHNTDTTGGLKGKLDACKDLFDHTPNLETIEIFNGLDPHNFEKALSGEAFTHTHITK